MKHTTYSTHKRSACYFPWIRCLTLHHQWISIKLHVIRSALLTLGFLHLVGFAFEFVCKSNRLVLIQSIELCCSRLNGCISLAAMVCSSVCFVFCSICCHLYYSSSAPLLRHKSTPRDDTRPEQSIPRLRLVLLTLILATGIATATSPNNLPAGIATTTTITTTTTTTKKKRQPRLTTWGQIYACFAVLDVESRAHMQYWPFDPHPNGHVCAIEWDC